ncbi:hypothetical protein BSKO_03092 [Bryopsis sp. KO-2023]|nr:hypothetical protein BSKO_03092 [Bryopsis sp. KO-2023]
MMSQQALLSRPGSAASIRPAQPQCLISARPSVSGRRFNHIRAVAAEPSTLESFSFESDLDFDAEDVKELYKDFDDILETARVQFSPGDIVSGEVYSVDNKGAYVDFGGKQIGWCSSADASLVKDAKSSDVFKPDMTREFKVVSTGGKRKGFDTRVTLLSARLVQEEVAWKRIVQLMENDIDLKGTVTGFNRGGFMMDLMGLTAFCPFSQTITGMNEPEKMIGKVLDVKVLDVDQSNGRLVVSNRRAGSLSAALEEFKVGSVVTGTVTSIATFGAFVDVGGGVVGLLHISQITHGRVTDVNKILGVGDKLKVMILSFDRIRRRVSLSTKKLEPNPGDMLSNPALVYEKADEMAEIFREQVALAEARAEEEERRLAEESNVSF